MLQSGVLLTPRAPRYPSPEDAFIPSQGSPARGGGLLDAWSPVAPGIDPVLYSGSTTPPSSLHPFSRSAPSSANPAESPGPSLRLSQVFAVVWFVRLRRSPKIRVPFRWPIPGCSQVFFLVFIQLFCLGAVYPFWCQDLCTPYTQCGVHDTTKEPFSIIQQAWVCSGARAWRKTCTRCRA